jgi:LCP family protein required for cell wall assembly
MDESSKYGKLLSKSLGKRRVTISRLKRRILRHLWVVRLSLLGLGILIIFLLFFLLSLLIRKTGLDYYIGFVGNFVFTPSEKIEAIDDRTNILVLGKGGAGHEAPDLTDTIIFVSVSHQKPSVTLISLPRDIWVPSLRAKLNSTYYWGNQKEAGGGLILAKSSVEEIVGAPVQYGIVIDFSGFKEVIDVLEGIEVDVERAFVDERYPIPGREDDECDDDPEYKCRYETIKFEKRIQLMDGETALKFVRSRNAEGDEGTDFARAERQQKAVEAMKDKILSREVLLSPKRMFALWDILIKYSETDIDAPSATILARRFLQSKGNITSHILSEDLLINPPQSPKYDNLYVFIPKENGWNKVHGWVECVLEQKICD